MNNYPAIRIALAEAMGWTKNRGKGWSRAVPANERDMTWESREHCPDPKHSDADCMALVDFINEKDIRVDIVRWKGGDDVQFLYFYPDGRRMFDSHGLRLSYQWAGDNYREGVVALAYKVVT